jgi:hypothetical protein
MSEARWFVGGASVRGKSHAQGNTPCQDANKIKISPNGKWLALVVSDGAGSAKNSDKGSKLISEAFANSLISLSEKLDNNNPGAWVADILLYEILRSRSSLRDLAGSDSLKDYHCTLVAVLIGPSGGFSIHLGDGGILGASVDCINGKAIDLSASYFESKPENGEYANETFFVTETDWIKHIRIEPLPPAAWIILGTDGGMALTTAIDGTPKSGFIKPLIQIALSQKFNTDNISEEIKKLVSDPQADRLTNDDKTLVIAVNASCNAAEGEFHSNAPTEVLPPNAAGFHDTQAIEQNSNLTNGATNKELDKSLSTLTKKNSNKHIGIFSILTALLFGVVAASAFFILKEKFYSEKNVRQIQTTPIGPLKIKKSIEAEVLNQDNKSAESEKKDAEPLKETPVPSKSQKQ